MDMENHDINNGIQYDGMPSPHEELEARRAFVRMRVPAPDVDAAWEQFKTVGQPLCPFEEIMEKRGVKGKCVEGAKSPQAVMSLASQSSKFKLLAVAASVAVLFVLYGVYSASKPEGEVFTANDEPQQVSYTTEGGEAVVVKGNAVDFSSAHRSRASNSEPHIIKMVTLTTSRGKTVRACLPDGSVVWLNADSRMEFPERFTGGERRVRATGEVYFDVRKDSRHPFVVETDYFTSTVLGTSFNVRVRSSGDASLTLISGKVDISGVGGQETHEVLRPGEQAVWSSDKGLDISSVDTYPMTQWKDGYFYFNNEPLVKIMQELGRWYNVSVVFEKPQDMQRRVHFIAEHTDRLDDIVRRLDDLGIVGVSLSDGVVIVK